MEKINHKRDRLVRTIALIAGIVLVAIAINPRAYSEEIELAIGSAILAQNQNHYYPGEAQTEGHKVLKVVEGNNHQYKVYCIVSYGEFGFQNGIFAKISGSGAIPTVITLSRDEQGGYHSIAYDEPQDGENNFKSTMEMFPLDLYLAVFQSEQYYDDLCLQQEAYAKKYLDAIGKGTSEISSRHVEKTLAKMNAQASNQLGRLFPEYPYWIGTQEKLEDDIRYIYRKEYDSIRQVVTFTKEKEDGAIVEKYVIDTAKGELAFLEGTPRYSK